jgi:hypothetical protein
MYFSAIPTAKLKLLRSIASIAANGMGIKAKANLSGLSSDTNQMIAERIVTPAMHAIDEVMDRHLAEFYELLDPTKLKEISKDTMDIIMECTPLSALMEYGMTGLEELKKLLRKLIKKAWKRTQSKSVQGKYTVKLMADSKLAKVLLAYIDAAISAIDQGNLCAKKNHRPSLDELEGLVNNMAADTPVTLNLPTGGDPFTTFNGKPFETSRGIIFPRHKIGKETQEPGSAFRIADCANSSVDPRVLFSALGIGESFE